MGQYMLGQPAHVATLATGHIQHRRTGGDQRSKTANPRRSLGGGMGHGDQREWMTSLYCTRARPQRTIIGPEPLFRSLTRKLSS